MALEFVATMPGLGLVGSRSTPRLVVGSPVAVLTKAVVSIGAAARVNDYPQSQYAEPATKTASSASAVANGALGDASPAHQRVLRLVASPLNGDEFHDRNGHSARLWRGPAETGTMFRRGERWVIGRA